jgi:hypothetical protein
MQEPMRDTPETSARSNAAVAYYENGPELSGLVLDALPAAGSNADPLDPDDLAGLDEVHGLGRAATLTLAELAGISSSERAGRVARASGSARPDRRNRRVTPAHGCRRRGHHARAVMPNFEARMAGLARNLSDQRIGMVMAVLSRS